MKFLYLIYFLCFAVGASVFFACDSSPESGDILYIDPDSTPDGDTETSVFQWPAITVTADGPFKTWQEGYITTGPWHGYAFTSTRGSGTTTTPEAFTTTAPGFIMWMQGAIPAGSGAALVGFNISQQPGAGTVAAAVVPPGDGVYLQTTNTANTPLQIEIRGSAGETDPSQRWCAPISTSQSSIPWNAFKKGCGDGGTTASAYAKEPIVSILVQAAGSGSSTVNYNFQLNDIYPIDDGNTDGILRTPAGTLSGTQARNNVQRNSEFYAVQSNVWSCNSGAQTISYVGNNFTVTAQTCDNSGSNAPASYPSSFIGNNNNRNPSNDNLPKLVSSISSINTSWTWSDSGAWGTYNAAYDVWFTNANSGNITSPDKFLMVWFHSPSGKVPRGSQQWSGVTVPGVSGSWNVWTDGTCISYISTNKIYTLTFDLNAFIKDATNVHTGTISSNLYLHDVFAGFEIWSGGQGLSSTNFSAVVQ